MTKEIKRICDKRPEDITMIEYQNLKLSMLNQLGRINRTCDGVRCTDCCLNNKDDKDSCTVLEIIYPQETIKKVQEWHKENTLKVDWSKVPVDTKIIVWDNDLKKYKVKRYFAKFEDGKIYAWNNGMTSWSVEKDKHVSTKWDNAELTEEKIYE